MNGDYLKGLVACMDFGALPSAPHIFTKIYQNNYTLSVDFQNQKISYGSEIKVNHNNILNFAQPENFVVLECVNRLLEKGYDPQSVELERMFPFGHNPVAGRADITVYDRRRKALFVIECKTYGSEYNTAVRKLRSNVGQLFTYLQQDRNTRFICLYTSRWAAGALSYENLIVRIKDTDDVLKKGRKDKDVLAYINAAEAKDFHRVWIEQYDAFSTPNGIFDDDITAYNPAQVPIKRKDLKPFSEEEGRKFFNEFAEILRHNNVSDNSNAFNQILSLVLCKIVDEQKEPDKVTEFQIQDAREPPEQIQDRLQSLYAQGMEKFLKERIIYISEKEIEDVLKSFPIQSAKDRVKSLFIQQKYYSNNEFAFKEVHNEKLFRENAKVLIEILQLLQYKQFRYERKDTTEYKLQKRYLGDFFELLLDAGYKQTAGQFFTPLPIAKFIVSSLPICQIVKQKIADGQTDFLPLLIDYACGSGHFLVEAIEEIQECVDSLELDYDDSTNARIKHWQQTDWTKGFLFGIERDYRLARTAKLACFMNGDGETNIILADGLEDHRQIDPNFPVSFDILVANPPYSIKDFKTHTQKSLKYNQFELMGFLTESASEIEVLFVERLAQLLHPTAVSGIILPSSILSNAKIYTKAREILLRHFEIRAIVELGTDAFMATGTNTVTLFLKKRKPKVAVDAAYVAADFIINNKSRKNDFADTENILAEYARTLDFTIEDYQTFLGYNPNDIVLRSDWYEDYRIWFESLPETKRLRRDPAFLTNSDEERTAIIDKRFFSEVLTKEKDKFEFFFLVYGQSTLVVKANPKKKNQQRFLGYGFSRAKGKEGIKFYGTGGKIASVLYDETWSDNPEKLNFIVRQMVEPELFDYQTDNFITPPILPTSLEKQATVVDLSDCIDFSRVEFEKQIRLSAKSRSRTPIASDKWEQRSFTKFAKLEYGSPLKEENRIDGEYPVMGSNGIVGYHNEYLIEGPAIIVGRKGSMGKVNWIDANSFPIDTTFYVSYDPNQVELKYLFQLLLQFSLADYGGGIGVPGLNRNEIHRLKLPIPPVDDQRAILREIEGVEKIEKVDRDRITKARNGMSEKVNTFFDHQIKASGRSALDSYFDINLENVNPESFYGEELFTYVRGESIGKGNGYIDYSEKIMGIYAPSRARRIAPDQSVIVSTVRPNLRGFAYLPIVPEDCVFSTGLAILSSKDESAYLAKTLYYFFMFSSALMQQLENKMPKAAYPSVNEEDIKSVQIPAVAFPAQKTLMRQLAAYESKIEEAERNLIKFAEQKAQIIKAHLSSATPSEFVATG